MNAKACYDKKTAAFAGFLIQNIPEELSDEEMQGWMDNPDATKKFLSGLKSQETVPAKPIPLFSIAATTNLGVVGDKKTEKCFTGSRYSYRDNDIDNWLPGDQPKAEACAISALAFSREWTFVEIATAILGIGVGTEIKLLGKLLIEHGHTMTLVQVEEMIEKTERGEETKMRVDGYGNFFFVETGDEENPVSVRGVIRGGRDWYADVYQLGSDRRWSAGNRFLLRNLLDTSTL